jgi:hypothetical protein
MEVSEDQPFEELHRIGQPKSVSEDLGLLRKIRRELSLCRPYLSGMEEDRCTQ